MILVGKVGGSGGEERNGAWFLGVPGLGLRGGAWGGGEGDWGVVVKKIFCGFWR